MNPRNNNAKQQQTNKNTTTMRTTSIAVAFLLAATTSSCRAFSSTNTNTNTNTNSNNYRLTPDAGPMRADCDMTEAQIHDAIAGRLKFQQSREFDQADALLEALNLAGVHVHDKRKEWRADGEKSFGSKKVDAYVRRGGLLIDGSDSETNMNEIVALVEQRSQAKKERNFDLCSELETRLKDNYQVQLDDKRREWSFLPTSSSSTSSDSMVYVPSPLATEPDDPTNTMDETTKSIIQQLLVDRVTARNYKNFQMADNIIDQLWKKYNVVADDRTQEWKVVTHWESDPFVTDAVASQKSAFARARQKNPWTSQQQQQQQQSSSNKEQYSAENTRALMAELEAEAEERYNNHNDNDDVSNSKTAPESLQEQEDPAVVAPAPADKNRETLTKMTVVDLKEMLRTAGLPVSGKKVDLVERIIAGK